MSSTTMEIVNLEDEPSLNASCQKRSSSSFKDDKEKTLLNRQQLKLLFADIQVLRQQQQLQQQQKEQQKQSSSKSSDNKGKNKNCNKQKPNSSQSLLALRAIQYLHELNHLASNLLLNDNEMAQLIDDKSYLNKLSYELSTTGCIGRFLCHGHGFFGHHGFHGHPGHVGPHKGLGFFGHSGFHGHNGCKKGLKRTALSSTSSSSSSASSSSEDSDDFEKKLSELDIGKDGEDHRHRHHHGHGHSHGHDHSHGHGHSHGRSHSRGHSRGHNRGHQLDDSEPHQPHHGPGQYPFYPFIGHGHRHSRKGLKKLFKAYRKETY